MHTTHRTYAQIAKAITYFSRHQFEQPGLSELADAIGISEFHLQRLFTEWVGVSPKEVPAVSHQGTPSEALRQSTVMDAALSQD